MADHRGGSRWSVREHSVGVDVDPELLGGRRPGGAGPAAVGNDDARAVLAEGTRRGAELQGPVRQGPGSQQDLHVPRLQRERHMDARLADPAASGWSSSRCRRTRRSTAGCGSSRPPVPAVDVRMVTTRLSIACATSSGRVGRASCWRGTEEPRDEVTAGRESGFHWVHPPSATRRCAHRSAGPPAWVHGAEGGPVQLGQVGDQAGAAPRCSQHGAAQGDRRRRQPAVADRLAVAGERRQPCLAPVKVHRTPRDPPKRPGDQVPVGASGSSRDCEQEVCHGNRGSGCGLEGIARRSRALNPALKEPPKGFALPRAPHLP